MQKIFNSKRAQTDTVIIMAIIAFQAFVIIGLGFINADYTSATSVDTMSFNESYVVQNYNVPLTNFSFANIITSIIVLGWANTLLFAPLIGGVVYIIAKLIRGGG